MVLSVDKDLVEEINKKIDEDAIMQHIMEKEKRDGIPELGVKAVACSYALYQRWKATLNN